MQQLPITPGQIRRSLDPRSLDPEVQRRDVNSPAAGLGTGTNCLGASPVVAAGGDAVARLLPKNLVPFERMYRKAPPAAAYGPGASPSHPVFFELGAFAVDNQQALIVLDYEFSAYRAGTSPFDPIPLEPERLSTSLGFTLGGRSTMQANAQYALVPTATELQQQQLLNQNSLQVPFPDPLALLQQTTFTTGSGGLIVVSGQANIPQNPTVFSQAQGSVQSPASGSPVLPQTRAHLGARDVPFALYYEPSSSVQLQAVVFAPLPIPLAYVQATVSGFLVNSNLLEALLMGVRTCT